MKAKKPAYNVRSAWVIEESPGRGVWGEEDGDARTRREDRKEGTLEEEIREKRTAARGHRDYREEGRRWEDCVHIHVNGPAHVVM